MVYIISPRAALGAPHPSPYALGDTVPGTGFNPFVL